MTPIELLAPAKTAEIGKIAIRHGADAVYIGAPRFSARAAAGVSVEDIHELCLYAHRFGCRVLVALNTLLRPEELKEAEQIIWQVYEAGADALIVQDMQILNLNLPPIRLHASTQCDNRTAEDVIDRIRSGFSQVVLARELTLPEMREIRKSADEYTQRHGLHPVALEAFIHGARCVCYSGKCFLSERLRGRSANRGECAQLCRLTYDLIDGKGEILQKETALLSPPDMNRTDILEGLLDAGITTLKIEGRLKDADYVKNVVAWYRKKLDQLFSASAPQYGRSSYGRVTINFEPDYRKSFFRALRFNNKSTGELLNPDTPLHNGDGVISADGKEGFYLNGEKDILTVKRRIQGGEKLYRNLDREFQNILAREDTATRELPIQMRFEPTEDGFRLTAGNVSAEIKAEHQEARNPGKLREQLSKLGGSGFYLEQPEDLQIDGNWFLPASQANALRREAVQALDAELASLTSFTSLTSSSSITSPTSLTSPSSITSPTSPVGLPAMLCRWCIRKELGICARKAGQLQPDGNAAPLYLQHGRDRLKLTFDCTHCEMAVDICS